MSLYALRKSLWNALLRARNAIQDKPLSNEIKQPVFIVACGHSGTTLMLNLVGKHPAFHPIPFESNIFWPHVSFAQVKRFFTEQQKEAGDLRILEKTPRHVREIKRILKLFPDARIIAMIRDGRDVACSMLKRDVPLERGIKRWIMDCGHIAEWKDDERVKVVKYENLVGDQEQTLVDLTAFLGVDSNLDAMLSTDEAMDWGFSRTLDVDSLTQEEWELRQRHNKRRNEQINKPIYNDAGKWKDKLSNDEAALLQERAGRILQDWGYALS